MPPAEIRDLAKRTSLAVDEGEVSDLEGGATLSRIKFPKSGLADAARACSSLKRHLGEHMASRTRLTL